MYLKPMPHSCSLRPYFAAMRSSMRVVLNARTISPGHCLRFSSHSRITAKHLCASTKLPSSATAPRRSASPSVASPAWQCSLHDSLLQHRDVRRYRLGIDSRKQRIQFAANLEVIDAILGEDALQHAASGAIHHVDGKLESGFLDCLQIDEVLDGGDVGRLEIGERDAAALALQARRIQFALDRPHDRRRARAAIIGLVLHAVPVEGIVAGGDHHAAGRAQILHRVRQRRSRRVVVRQAYGNARGGEHFGDNLRRLLRDEARVVADDQAFAGVLVAYERSAPWRCPRGARCRR